jgi:hypothetical protein
MCRTPAAPTLYQSTDVAHSIRLSIIAERFAPLTSVSNDPSESWIHPHKAIDCVRLGSLLRSNHFLGPDPLIELIIGD